jgi:hypothetical protein
VSEYRGAIATASLNFLRERRGRKFSAEEIAGETGFHAPDVKRSLHARFHDGRYGLQRVFDSNKTYLWFIGEASPASPATREERAVARWMAEHGAAARPSAISAGARVALADVAAILDRWAGQGNVVRCELLLRTGADRFEYRLSQGAIAKVWRNYPTKRAEASRADLIEEAA